MLVALIPPFDCLDLVIKYNTGYHLILPQLLTNETYFEVYSQIEGYKILDNGAAEDVGYDQTELHAMAARVGAHEIVVPDVLGDCDATILLAEYFKRWARTDQFNYVGVVQGKNMAEVMKCLTYFDNSPWISRVAVPRILNQTIEKTFRYTFLNALIDHDLEHPKFGYRFRDIHCLGYSQWTREAVALAPLPYIRGLDTSFPFVQAMYSESVRGEYKSRPAQYFDVKFDRNSYEWELLNDNIRTFLDWSECRISEAPQRDL